MPYVYIGQEAIYHGRPLFRLLANLKNFGAGRVVYRQSEYEAHPEQVHFYRILHAQPLMDKETLEGNVVAERVFKSLRTPEPFVLAGQVSLPDYRLVPKEEEEAFCKLEKVRDYDPKLDAPRRPKFVQMGPVMQKLMNKDNNKSEDDLKLPAHLIYEGDVILEDETRPHKLANFIEGQFDSFKDFDASAIPESWNDDRLDLEVGRKKWIGFTEGLGWEQQMQRDEEESNGKQQGEEEAAA